MARRPIKELSLLFTVVAMAMIHTSCTNAVHDQQMASVVQTVQRLQGDVENIAFQLNGYNVELDILEERSNKNQSLSSDQQQLKENVTREQRELKHQLSILENRISTLEKRNESIIADIRQIQAHANATGTSLSQYKGKINSLEKEMTHQSNKVHEVVKTLNIMGDIIEKGSAPNEGTYTIKAGDSLEKIARSNNTSIEAIKKANNLKSDLIVVGQTLTIPK